MEETGRRKFITRFFFCLVIMLAELRVAQAATRYVSPQGKNVGTCAVETACATIKYAVGQAASGDTVDLAPGTYTEAGITLDKNLILRGADAANTIVQAAYAPSRATNRVFLVAKQTTVSFQNLTIRHGRSVTGGGIHISAGASATISDSYIEYNSVGPDGLGGGIFVGYSASATIDNSTIAHNSHHLAPVMDLSAGGGIFSYCFSTLTIKNSTISDNYDFSNGGGIDATSKLTVINSKILRNRAHEDGGIHSLGEATINDSQISDNYGYSGGGGIGNAGSMELIGSTVSNNGSHGEGGGILTGGVSLTIRRSTISGNAAGGGGGIQHQPYSLLVIENSTISDNTATYGGGLHNSGPTQISNSTLSGNKNSGIINLDMVNIKNSIVANNTAVYVSAGEDCSNYDQNSVIKVTGVNFDTDQTCPGFTHVTKAQLDLANLALNPPGSTATHALGPGSVAINAANDCKALDGTTLKSDQRGAPRPQPPGGKCDVGSYEMGGGNIFLGDVNADGRIDVLDVQALQLHVDDLSQLSDEALKAADVNRDGLVDRQDVVYIAKAGIGLAEGLKHTLTVLKTGAGRGSVASAPVGIKCGRDCAAGFASGVQVTLTAARVWLSSFAGWTGCDTVIERGVCVLNMTGDRQVTAAFEPQPSDAVQPAEPFTPIPSEPELSVPAVRIGSTKLPPGGSGPLELTVHEAKQVGGVAALQGRIAYDPQRIQIKQITGVNAFVLEAFAIDREKGELRFSLVRVAEQGIDDGPAAVVVVQAAGQLGRATVPAWDETALEWAGNAEAPAVVATSKGEALEGVRLEGGRVMLR